MATIVLSAAIIVMLNIVPFSNIFGLLGLESVGIGIGRYISILAEWIMATPNMAAQRAIKIGLGLGGVATALKIILGYERGYLGRD